MYIRRFPLLCLALTTLIWIPLVFGQSVTATLVGTVSDNSGAVIGDAKVTITEQRTGASLTQSTNSSGNYEFTFLPPGIYTVSATRQGFNIEITKDVQVLVNTTVRKDLALQPGSDTQSITVTDQAPLLETDRADVSAQIDTKQVED